MWNRIFDMENPVMRALGAVCDLLVLNLLTAVCCLPVVTCGAALSALFDVTLRIVRREETRVAGGYFRALRANFKQGLALGLLFLAAAAVLFADAQIALLYAPPLRVAAVAGALLTGAVALYAFALQARYENTVAGTLRNAVSLSVAYFPRTLAMLAFTVLFWLLCLTFFQIALPVLLMFGLSLPAYLCALLLQPVFQRLEEPAGAEGKKPEETDEAE